MIKPVDTPLRSRTAFVATVEPCTSTSSSPIASSSLRPPRIARDGSAGVESTLCTCSLPSCKSTISVNVPPVSTPASTPVISLSFTLETSHPNIPLSYRLILEPRQPTPALKHSHAGHKIRLFGLPPLWERPFYPQMLYPLLRERADCISHIHASALHASLPLIELFTTNPEKPSTT